MLSIALGHAFTCHWHIRPGTLISSSAIIYWFRRYSFRAFATRVIMAREQGDGALDWCAMINSVDFLRRHFWLGRFSIFTYIYIQMPVVYKEIFPRHKKVSPSYFIDLFISSATLPAFLYNFHFWQWFWLSTCSPWGHAQSHDRLGRYQLQSFDCRPRDYCTMAYMPAASIGAGTSRILSFHYSFQLIGLIITPYYSHILSNYTNAGHDYTHYLMQSMSRLRQLKYQASNVYIYRFKRYLPRKISGPMTK